MHSIFTKTFLALPIVGLLAFVPVAFAHEEYNYESPHDQVHDYLDNEHQAEHDNLNAQHEAAHQYPMTEAQHRALHRALEQEHRAEHQDLHAQHRAYHDPDYYSPDQDSGDDGRYYDESGRYDEDYND